MKKYKECKACKQRINKEASRCHHCSSDQGYFRLFSTAVLLAGFIMTLLSISLTPPIKELIDGKRADIRVSILEGDPKEITFMISNIGNRPAGISGIEIESSLKSGSATWFLQSDLDKKVLEPGKAYIIKASNGSLIPEPIPHEVRAMLEKKKISLDHHQCQLVITYIQLDGDKYYLPYNFPCNQNSA